MAKKTLVLSPEDSGDPAGLGTSVTHTSGGGFGNPAKGWGWAGERESKQSDSPHTGQAGSDYAVWAGTVWLPKEESEVKKLPDHSGPGGTAGRGDLGWLGSERVVFSPAQTKLAL